MAFLFGVGAARMRRERVSMIRFSRKFYREVNAPRHTLPTTLFDPLPRRKHKRRGCDVTCDVTRREHPVDPRRLGQVAVLSAGFKIAANSNLLVTSDHSGHSLSGSSWN